MWNDRYSTEDYYYGTEPNDFLREHVYHLPEGPVLCLAEGEGRNAVFLATNGHPVTAIDSSAQGKRKADRLAAAKGTSLNYRVCDLVNFDAGYGVWAGIVSIFVHLPPPLRQAVHAQTITALKPGGVLLLEAYTPRQLDHGTGGPPSAVLTMDEAILRKELSELEILLLREVEREVIEGRGHRGTGAVVQLIARKPA
jgi:hypothetical protein